MSCAGRGGQLTDYQLEVTSVTSGQTVAEYSVTSQTAVIDNLTPYVRYSVRVRMRNNQGVGPYSNELVQVTAQARKYPPISYPVFREWVKNSYQNDI